MSIPRRRPTLVAALGAALALVTTSACSGGSSDVVGAPAATQAPAAAGSGGTINLYAYAVPKPGFDKLIPAFAATPAGQGVTFQQSYGASGDQSRKVAAGATADIVNFSVEPDVTRLVDAGLVDAGWNSGPQKGIPFGSVVTIVVRKGNPKGIKDWDDLLKPGVNVVTPNPFSSGSARWNLMAVYGTAINEGKSPEQALEAVKTVLEKTKAQPGSGSDALAAFTQGEGDVLLSYENEAIKAENEGEDVEYVIPPSTIQIETPIAVTESAPEPAAEDFLEFLWSDEGQELWAENGYRPVNSKLVDPKQFPTPKELFKISQFGGWGKVNDEFFDDETGSVAKIESELGVSTSG
jgi:sulfate transport system substrate-binding protein